MYTVQYNHNHNNKGTFFESWRIFLQSSFHQHDKHT